jgi:hypothetical protein
VYNSVNSTFEWGKTIHKISTIRNMQPQKETENSQYYLNKVHPQICKDGVTFGSPLINNLVIDASVSIIVLAVYKIHVCSLNY